MPYMDIASKKSADVTVTCDSGGPKLHVRVRASMVSPLARIDKKEQRVRAQLIQLCLLPIKFSLHSLR